MIDPCKEHEPHVINNKLIEKCIDLQYPKGEVGRLLRSERTPMEEVEEIHFEYLYIIKIDHLWVLKSLTKLSLSNNLIEKIEGLESLIHLKELDLSFNKISKIENLETLIKLEKITFYENLIQKIENLDNQINLKIFSIGKNKIENKTEMNYFRTFPSLTSLNMAGNPCTVNDENFRYYVAAFLPNLIYYEYKKITNDERQQAQDLFQYELTILKRKEEIEIEKKQAIEKELRDAEMHSKMFVEHMNNGKLFDMMYEDDIEGNALLEIGDPITEFYYEYKIEFHGYCKEIYLAGEKHYNMREEELGKFYQCIDKMKKHNQNESIEHIEKFQTNKSEIFNEIVNYQTKLEYDAITQDFYKDKLEEYRKNFNEIIHTTWKNLMGLELRLFEQLEEVNQNVLRVMEEMINNFIEEARSIFANIRAAEVTYSEHMNEATLAYMAQTNEAGDNKEMRKQKDNTEYTKDINNDDNLATVLKNIISDKDNVANAITATHDVHMQIIDAREDKLIQRSKLWLQDLTTQLTENEISRNRYKLLEINHFLDIQREEFDKLITSYEFDVEKSDNDDDDND